MIVSFDKRAAEALSGDRTGQHSIRMNGQWRIVFRWIESHAHDVAVVDYH
jgi:proteic killer suppression protein